MKNWRKLFSLCGILPWVLVTGACKQPNELPTDELEDLPTVTVGRH